MSCWLFVNFNIENWDTNVLFSKEDNADYCNIDYSKLEMETGAHNIYISIALVMAFLNCQLQTIHESLTRKEAQKSWMSSSTIKKIILGWISWMGNIGSTEIFYFYFARPRAEPSLCEKVSGKRIWFHLVHFVHSSHSAKSCSPIP